MLQIVLGHCPSSSDCINLDYLVEHGNFFLVGAAVAKIHCKVNINIRIIINLSKSVAYDEERFEKKMQVINLLLHENFE